MFKKTILLLLVLAMTVGVFVSCGRESTGRGDENTSTQKQEQSGDPVVDNNPFNKTRKDYATVLQTEDFNIYTWVPQTTEYITQDVRGESHEDIIERALIQRDELVMEKLKVDIQYQTAQGAYDYMASFMQPLEDSILVGDGAIDAVAQYSLVAGQMARKGLYNRLNPTGEWEAEHEESMLDLDQPWWPASIQESTSIDGRFYFITGDIAVNTITNAQCLFFNKEQLDRKGLASPYEMVEDNEWTWENFIAMLNDTFEEGGDQETMDDDFYGLVICDLTTSDSFYASAGFKLIDKDEEGQLKVSDDFTSTRAADFLGVIKNMVYSKDVYDGNNFGDWQHTNYFGIYGAGQGVFAAGALLYAQKWQQFGNFEYGVVPLPKYTKEQDKYYTILTKNHTLWAIPFDTISFSRSTDVLNCLCYEAYEIVTPAVYDNTFKGRLLGEDDEEMLDLIRDGIVHDFGNLFGEELYIYAVFRKTLKEHLDDWGSRTAEQKGKIEGENGRLDRLYQDLLANAH